MELIIEHLSSFTGLEISFLNKLFSFLGLVGTLVLAPTGILYAVWLYRIRRFTDQITYSETYLEEVDEKTWLRLRTPTMLPIGDILPANPLFNLALWNAIRKCTLKDPFIRMSHDDMDILQPSICNAFSMTFAEGMVAYMFDYPVDKKQLLYAITFEKDGRMRNQKIRVIIVTEENLIRFKDEGLEETVCCERSHHVYRLYTLRLMCEQFLKEKSLPSDALKIVRPIETFIRT